MGPRARRVWWWGGATVGALLVLAALGSGLATAYLRRSLPRPDVTVLLPSLHGRVLITRDSYGIPSIAAQDLHDLLFALGYVHAQDRLWQMDLARRVAQGRLAEAFGAAFEESDRFLRAVGLWRAAARVDSVVAGDVRALIQSYADGVNAWSTSGQPLPPEFVLLRLTPEPWTVRHSLAVAKLMTWDLTEWDLSLELARAVDRLGAELAQELSPRVAGWEPRIVPSSDGRAAPAPAESVGRWAAGGWAEALPEVPPELRPFLEGAGIARASNSWVIGPSRSRSGRPILANDMHLPLRAPPTWYLAGLHGPELDVVGMTLPGVPGVVAGHNRRVAWGFTAAMVDNIDFFIEEVDPQDRNRYRTPYGWERMTFREETLTVRGGSRPVVFRVAETRHGPVLPPSTTALRDVVVAMQWTGAEPTQEARAILRLNRAREMADVVGALRDFGNPGLNVVFADADGNIGYWLVGLVPVRRSGDGVLPASGASGAHDWIGAVAFESLPHVINPRSGYVATANNIPRDGGPFIGAHFMSGYRAARIAQLIQSGSVHDALTVHEMQLDVHSLFADRHLRRAVRAARDAGEEESATRLEGWDRRARADSRAAAVFYTWIERLRWAIASDEYGDSLGYFPWEVLDRILTRGESPWLDDRRTSERESLRALSARAMREAVDLVGSRDWGELHTVTSAHALGEMRWLDAWLGMNVGPYPAAGEPFVVNAAYHRGLAPPYRVTWGVSQRHVVDLGDPDGAGGFILPTGESGHPLSSHYEDQVQAWRFGGLRPIPVDRGRAKAIARTETVLAPSPGPR